jgi:hypothetical protein
MYPMYRVLSLLVASLPLLIFPPFQPSAWGGEYRNIPGLIHLDSKISGGKFSPEELVQKARANGFKVVIITDHDTNRWEYGIQPLRKAVKKTMERGSITSYGVERYLEIFKQLNQKYPDVVSIHAAEAIPFYYWEGSYFKNNLTLRNGHKHLLVIGLNKASDYKNLPSVGNGFPLQFRWFNLLGLWPLVMLLWGVRLIFMRKRILGSKKLEPVYSRPYTLPGIVLFLLGILFLFNNYPFAHPMFDQYHGDQGVAPYQLLIDYVKEKGGMVFWAHPETYQSRLVEGIQLVTEPYYHDLLVTKDYTGFAVFWEGNRFLGKPGGIWDRILLEYCYGKRNNPIWAIAEAEYENDTFPIKGSQTIFLLRKLDRDSVLDALRKGRIYAVCGSGEDQLVLDTFIIQDRVKKNKGMMGEEISLTPPALISIKVSDPALKKMPYTIRLIRNGNIVKTFPGHDQTELEYEDNYFQKEGKTYYRLEVEGKSKIVSNPIFVNYTVSQ